MASTDASAAAAAVFPAGVERFRKGIEALNAVGPERMPLVLSRVIASIHASGTYAFTEKEEAQLREVLAVDADVVRLSLETAAYIFERAALFSLKAPQLLALLGDTGLEEAHLPHVDSLQCSAFATVWASDSAAYLARLRAKPFGAPLVLEDFAWRLSLGVGSSGDTAVKTSTAIMDLDLRADRPTTAASASAHERFAIEFSREQLLAFFEKLDRVQQQIDALSA